jgi:putative CocE/NonD family hydrolase
MRRLPARGLPDPVCRVAVQHRIEVPAANGVPLLTDHYIPLADGPCPTLLVRGPFSRGFPWDYVYGAQFAAQGFHVLIQSCRGTGGSGGTFDPWRNERADGQATVAWLRQQDWFSGALGGIGTSYLGYAAWAPAAGSPPELRAIVADGSADPRAFFYPGGAFALESALVGAVGYLSSERGPASAATAILRLRRHQRRVARSLPLIDAYPAALGGRSEMFEQWLTDPDPAGPYWSGLDLGAATAKLAVPVSLVSGWYDVQLDQTLEQYRRLRGEGSDVRLRESSGSCGPTFTWRRGWGWADGPPDTLVNAVVVSEFGEVPGRVVVLAESAGGRRCLIASKPRQPLVDLPLRRPLVPGGVPSQHRAASFLKQSSFWVNCESR